MVPEADQVGGWKAKGRTKHCASALGGLGAKFCAGDRSMRKAIWILEELPNSWGTVMPQMDNGSPGN